MNISTLPNMTIAVTVTYIFIWQPCVLFGSMAFVSSTATYRSYHNHYIHVMQQNYISIM